MPKHKNRSMMQIKPGRENPVMTRSIDRAATAAVLAERRKFQNFHYRKLEAIGLIRRFERMIDTLSGIIISEGRLWHDDNGERRILPVVPTVEKLAGRWQDYLNGCELFVKNDPGSKDDVQADVQRYQPIVNNIRAAVNKLYRGEDDGSMLRRAMQPLVNEIIADDLDRWKGLYKKRGVKPQEVITRLCERAKPHKKAGLTWEQIYTILEAETQDDPDAWQEYEKLIDWGVDNLRRRYTDKYGTN